MFDRLTHPVMITLTVPNPKKISKHTFTMFRQRVRAWIAQWNESCKGGVYSIETTYNRTLKTWHIHAHVLADFSRPLPSKTNKVDFCGARAYAFTALKWRMEYDWLLLTMGKNPAGWVHDGKLFRPKNDPPKKSQKAIRKWKSAWDNYWFNFTRWVEAKREHSTLWAKYKMGGKWLLRPDLTTDETALYKRQEAWNARNTRVFDVRPVDDREGAAKEVLKYITKVANFSDNAAAIEEFCGAVKGARLVQTFGSWYGFNLETQFDPEPDDTGASASVHAGSTAGKSRASLVRAMWRWTKRGAGI